MSRETVIGLTLAAVLAALTMGATISATLGCGDLRPFACGGFPIGDRLVALVQPDVGRAGEGVILSRADNSE